MTEDEIFKLVENLEDAAIEFGDRRNSGFRYEREASREELHEARDELKSAIAKLYEVLT